MALADSIATALASVQSGEQTVLTSAFTQVWNDAIASVQSPTGDVTAAQEQIDIAAAVSAAVGPLNTQISAMQLAKSQEDALLASVQSAAQALVALFPAPAAPAPQS